MSMAPRERRLLAILGLLAVGFVATRVSSWLSEESDSIQVRRARRAAAAQAVDVVALDLGRLDRTPRDYAPGRDPFRYGQPPPPPRPPGPTPEQLAAMEAARLAAEQARLAAQAAAPPPGPRLPEFDLSYLGSFGPADRRVAVFADGDEIVNALVGDVLRGQFIVHQIGYESVDIAYKDFPDQPPARLAAGG